ncbi:MAG: hypothetical protein C4337_09055, partial [Armatimonadota bacterium]
MSKKLMWLVMCGLVLSVAVASAQEDVSQKRVTVKYDQADIRYVLKQLFDSVGANYSLAPEVQGTVTVSLTDVPFSVALDAVLRQQNLTYRVESGVYYITVRQPEAVPMQQGGETPQEEPQTTNLPEKIQLNYANPTLIASLLGATLVSYAQYEMSIGGMGGFGGFGGGLGGFGGGLGGF